MLLADVFEKFRNNSLKNYGLSTSHYLSAPGLNWEAMLKMTKIKLELIIDPTMHIFLEKGVRGGVSYIFNGYSKTNNKYLNSYDPKQESNHIIYLDSNNLYCYAMSKFLLTSEFKWKDPKEFDLNKYNSKYNSSKGCVFEVDLEYPKELWELNYGYALAPDKIEIQREMLSEYQLKIPDLYNIPIGNVKKLFPNFFDKEMYLIHYENLQLYLRLGSKLKKLHHVLEFNQSQWLKPYIKFHLQKRIEAEKNNGKNGKALYKLMSNAIHGKSMENLRNRINIKLGNNEKDCLKCTSKPSYMSHKIFGNNLVVMSKSKLALKLNKPEYIGMCILELSKNKYGNNSKLLFTVTDSLMYEIKTEDEDFNSDKEMFDFSNYSTKSKSNKLVIGKMKDKNRRCCD